MIVVDSSVIVDTVTGTEPRAWDRLLIEQPLAAPTLIDFEVLSALRGLERGRHLTEPRALDALSDFEQMTIHRWDTTEPLRRRIFDLRANFSAYDAAYVALAEMLDCTLLTRDLRLARAAERLVAVEAV